MKSTNWLFAAMAMMLIWAGSAMAQPELSAEQTFKLQEVEAQASVAKSGNWGIAMGAGLGACLTIIGAGFGISQIAGKAVESMARQPEVAGNINGAMIISAALIEGVTFFSLIVCILILVLI
jgi:F-type H+-transporting ATPase subunit c